MYDISGGNKCSFSNATRGLVCQTLVKKKKSTFVCVLRIFKETEIYGSGLIDLEDKISRQASVHFVALTLLSASSQIFRENQGQKQGIKIWNLNFGLEGIMWKVGIKGHTATKGTSNIFLNQVPCTGK